MCEVHGADWGGTFAGWMQQLLDDLANGISNAFSVFMHDETARNFSELRMLVVPGSNTGGE